MPAALSNTLRSEARSSIEKYDYYVLGIAAAVFAYAVDRWTPRPLGLNESTIQAAAIACLVAALVTGMKRVRHTIDHKFAASAQLFAQEQQQALPNNPLDGLSASTSSTSPAQQMLWREAYRHAELQAVTQSETERTMAERLGAIRDCTLLAGALLIAAAKIAPHAQSWSDQQGVVPSAASKSDQNAATDNKPAASSEPAHKKQ